MQQPPSLGLGAPDPLQQIFGEAGGGGVLDHGRGVDDAAQGVAVAFGGVQQVFGGAGLGQVGADHFDPCTGAPQSVQKSVGVLVGLGAAVEDEGACALVRQPAGQHLAQAAEPAADHVGAVGPDEGNAVGRQVGGDGAGGPPVGRRPAGRGFAGQVLKGELGDGQ